MLDNWRANNKCRDESLHILWERQRDMSSIFSYFGDFKKAERKQLDCKIVKNQYENISYEIVKVCPQTIWNARNSALSKGSVSQYQFPAQDLNKRK